MVDYTQVPYSFEPRDGDPIRIENSAKYLFREKVIITVKFPKTFTKLSEKALKCKTVVIKNIQNTVFLPNGKLN